MAERTTGMGPGDLKVLAGGDPPRTVLLSKQHIAHLKEEVDKAQKAAGLIYETLAKMATVADDESFQLFVIPAEAKLIVAHSNAMARLHGGEQAANNEWFDGDVLGSFLDFPLVVKSVHKRPMEGSNLKADVSEARCGEDPGDD